MSNIAPVSPSLRAWHSLCLCRSHGAGDVRDGFTRAHAIGLIWIGWTFVGATVLGAIVFSFVSGVRSIGQAFVIVGISDGISGLLAAALILTGGFVLGLGLGMPFIAAGELLRVALDQRRLLAEQARTLRRIRRGLLRCHRHARRRITNPPVFSTGSRRASSGSSRPRDARECRASISLGKRSTKVGP